MKITEFKDLLKSIQISFVDKECLNYLSTINHKYRQQLNADSMEFKQLKCRLGPLIDWVLNLWSIHHNKIYIETFLTLYNKYSHQRNRLIYQLSLQQNSLDCIQQKIEEKQLKSNQIQNIINQIKIIDSLPISSQKAQKLREFQNQQKRSSSALKQRKAYLKRNQKAQSFSEKCESISKKYNSQSQNTSPKFSVIMEEASESIDSTSISYCFSPRTTASEQKLTLTLKVGDLFENTKSKNWNDIQEQPVFITEKEADLVQIQKDQNKVLKAIKLDSSPISPRKITEKQLTTDQQFLYQSTRSSSLGCTTPKREDHKDFLMKTMHHQMKRYASELHSKLPNKYQSCIIKSPSPNTYKNVKEHLELLKSIKQIKHEVSPIFFNSGISSKYNYSSVLMKKSVKAKPFFPKKPLPHKPNIDAEKNPPEFDS